MAPLLTVAIMKMQKPEAHTQKSLLLLLQPRPARVLLGSGAQRPCTGQYSTDPGLHRLGSRAVAGLFFFFFFSFLATLANLSADGPHHP